MDCEPTWMSPDEELSYILSSTEKLTKAHEWTSPVLGSSKRTEQVHLSVNIINSWLLFMVWPYFFSHNLEELYYGEMMLRMALAADGTVSYIPIEFYLPVPGYFFCYRHISVKGKWCGLQAPLCHEANFLRGVVSGNWLDRTERPGEAT